MGTVLAAHLMWAMGSTVYLVTLLSHLFGERDRSQGNHHTLTSSGEKIKETLRHRPWKFLVMSMVLCVTNN